MSNIFDRLQLFSSVQFYFLEARDIEIPSWLPILDWNEYCHAVVSSVAYSGWGKHVLAVFFLIA